MMLYNRKFPPYENYPLYGIMIIDKIDYLISSYVERFRQAPATNRRSRETPSYSFWWRLDQDHVTPPGRHVTPPGCHVTPPGRHVTPPRTPQDHSTPDNTSKVHCPLHFESTRVGSVTRVLMVQIQRFYDFLKA